MKQVLFNHDDRYLLKLQRRDMICASESEKSSDNGDTDLARTIKYNNYGISTRDSLPNKQKDLLDMKNAMNEE